MINFIIAGAGGMGRELLGWLLAYAAVKYGPQGQAWEIRGFIDDNLAALDNFEDYPPVVGSISDYSPMPEDRIAMAIGKPLIRRKVAAKLIEAGAKFETVIHPTSIIFPKTKIGTGCIVGPFGVVSDTVELGDFVLINTRVNVAHDSIIGDYCELCPHVAISGSAVLEQNVFMGTGSVVAPGRAIRRSAKVSAGSTVMKNVKPGSLVKGVPGEEILNFFPLDD